MSFDLADLFKLVKCFESLTTIGRLVECVAATKKNPMDDTGLKSGQVFHELPAGKIRESNHLTHPIIHTGSGIETSVMHHSAVVAFPFHLINNMNVYMKVDVSMNIGTCIWLTPTCTCTQLRTVHVCRVHELYTYLGIN